MVIVEPWPRRSNKATCSNSQLVEEVIKLLATNPRGQNIDRVVVYPKKLPTDIRHNSKIFREKLTLWANQRFLR